MLLLCRSRRASPSRRQPLRRCLRAWPKVGGERRTKQYPIQLCTPPLPPPGQSAVGGVENKLSVLLHSLPPPPPAKPEDGG